MLSSLALAVAVSLLFGLAIVVLLTVRARAGRSDGTIARVLYETEHPNRRR